MTSKEIRIDAQLQTGLQIESVTAFMWIKDAINYIARQHPLAAPIETVTYESHGKREAGDSYEFDRELVRFEKVTKHNMRRPLEAPFFEVSNEAITFYHPGTFDITFRYLPDPPQTVEADLPIPDRYAETIKYYLSARMRARIYGQGDTDSQQYDQLFWSHLDEMDNATDLANRRYRRMPARY